MAWYRVAGQELYFDCPIGELTPFQIAVRKNGTANRAVPFISPSFLRKEWQAVFSVLVPPVLICQTVGWVADAKRSVETWSAFRGFLLRVAGGSDFFISRDGQTVQSLNRTEPPGMLNETDRQILLGPALVFALALRAVWCLHASAVMRGRSIIAFLAESGQGKSTLAAYLSQNAPWRLVADDILPVGLAAGGVQVMPHFPQLKLAVDVQPATGLAERLPLTNVCLLERIGVKQDPELQTITTAQGLQALISHIAGTRMFDSTLLARHLKFCAQAAPQVSFHRLSYPHRRDALPGIAEILRTIC